MNKFHLTLLWGLLLIPNINLACSCIEPSSFCESITDLDGQILPKVIIRGKVIKTEAAGKTVRIDHVIHGVINLEEILIRQGFCTIFFHELENDQEFVIALSSPFSTSPQNEFDLLACAISFLKIENETVKGKIAPDLSSMSYQEFVESTNCGKGFDNESLQESLSFYPNPTINNLKIKNSSSQLSYGNLKLKIFDIHGRLLLSTSNNNTMESGDIWKIDLHNYSTGIYVVHLSSDFLNHCFKLIKQ